MAFASAAAISASVGCALFSMFSFGECVGTINSGKPFQCGPDCCNATITPPPPPPEQSLSEIIGNTSLPKEVVDAATLALADIRIAEAIKAKSALSGRS